MQEGMDDKTDLMIDRLIYRQMWDSNWAWKTAKAVRKGVKELQFKKDNILGLKDNIQMHYSGLGREDA